MCRKIRIVRVEGLLGGLRLEWHLTPSVNILSGGNGSGKSTLLRAVTQMIINGELVRGCEGAAGPISTIEIDYYGDVARAQDVIAITRSLLSVECEGAEVDRVSDERLNQFYDIIDRLFAPSRKSVNRSSGVDNLHFTLNISDVKKIDIGFDWLSSGEQLVISLFRAVLLRPNASVLILDEPEISLSIEWQKSLIDNMLLLNPDLQIIIATHSPAIVMRGWVDCITEIDDILVEGDGETETEADDGSGGSGESIA